MLRLLVRYFPASLFLTTPCVLASDVVDLANTSSAWRIFFSLGLVLLLIPAVLFGIKKLQSLQFKMGKSPLKIASVHNLGGREKLVVVEVEQRILLLGVTANQISLLRELSSSNNFAEILEQEKSTGSTGN